jgi:tyrosine-protein phosphatase SIW14
MIRITPQRFRDLMLLAMVLVIGLFAIAPASTAVQVASTSETTIRNFGKVNENYYRGSQPTEVEMTQLKKMGIKTVIDLRRDRKVGAEDWAKKAGLQYFNIPLKSSVAATDDETNYFLTLVNDPANWPVYVHCKGGRHRTGALTGAYRISHDGWTAEQAFTEMKKYDFDNGLFGGPAAQKKFVFSFFEKQRHASGQPK